MRSNVKEQFLVSSFFTFFLIHSSQIGISILSFQNNISKDSKQDAWIAVIISGLSIHLLIWLIYRTLDEKHNDLISIHQFCFGKIIGNLLSILVLFYFLLSALTVFRTYIEVIQVWIYPNLQTWKLAILFGFMIFYLVSGGFRILTGFSFWSVIIPSILLIFIYFPLKHANPLLLQHMFNHSVKEIFKSAKAASLLYIGFEWLYMYYPFINNPKGSQKFAHVANLVSMILYTLIILISFMYFNQETLQHVHSATLSMTKIVKLPFIERFESIFIFIWLLEILIPICLPLWACTRILKRISKNFKPKISLVFFIIILIIGSCYIKDMKKLPLLTNFVSKIGFYFMYLYIPLLFLIKLFKSHAIKLLSRN
ncbi:GerAB/ArcD/ProY family transporter [Gottfriedia acidiceleris]|uniref:GerAB/ArcD/ProY family transporter n=1 Tax=Gottfriedia acidiceleris TaxID=371036 RepID=UPI002FFF66A6